MVPSDKVARWVVVGDDDDLVGLGLGLRDAHLLAALPDNLLQSENLLITSREFREQDIRKDF